MILNLEEQKLWERCADFHGHTCGGLAIGFQAARRAAALLGLTFSKDEEVVCVAENDACGIDAIQAVLGCSAGKGNLLFRMRGKQAFSFFNRKTGQSARLVLRPVPEMLRGERCDWMLGQNPAGLFDEKPVDFELPEPARLFESHPCEACGEMTAEPYLRLEQGRCLCLSCAHLYSRFF